MKKNLIILIIIGLIFYSCDNTNNNSTDNEEETTNIVNDEISNIVIKEIFDIYAVVELKPDISSLAPNQIEMLKAFIEVSKYIDTLFWYESMGDFTSIYNEIEDEKIKTLYKINFGPWDRFKNNEPIIEGVGAKPLGANFYPADITKEEFEEFNDSLKYSYYTFIRRDKSNKLFTVPYHQQYKEYISSIKTILNNAIPNCKNEEFVNYLKLRIEAMETDNYYKSDTTWMSLKNNTLDFLFGPIVIYEDKLFNKKAEHQAYVLLKDNEWSTRMEKYTQWLPFLQKAIPVPEEYRQENPGIKSAIYVYEVLYFGGSNTTGGMYLSLLQPLNHETQLEKGVINLQFKNVINTKFQAIIKPISNVLFVEEQKENVNQNAFFVNMLLYEMANSLGIRNTIKNDKTVRESLKEYYTITDILKNYVLSLYIAEKLHEVDELQNMLEDNYITFVTNIFRMIRFGTSSDYAMANLICYNYFLNNDAIIISDANTIEVNYQKMKTATEDLIKIIITMQGDGDYDAVSEFINANNQISDDLKNILENINNSKVPTDIIFEQGVEVLGI